MLYDSTIRRINRQIEVELRTVDSFIKSDDEKIAALDRIAKLTALLEPQPTSEMIHQELASLIVEARQKETYVPTRLSFLEILEELLSKRNSK